MKHLFVPALFGLAMAGCTSSEPQGLDAAVPQMEAAMPVPAAPSLNAAPASSSMPEFDQQPAGHGQAPTEASAPTSAAATSAAGFPPPPTCGLGAECAGPAQVEKCRTTGSVTTCDVPPDPAADSTRYTN